jgi:hypothetical protein
MRYSSKKRVFPKKDVLLICKIIVGCTKFINWFATLDAKKYARAKSHLQTKSLANTAAYYGGQSLTKEKPKFRPHEVRRKLPEDLQNIQDADLTDIHNSLVRVNHLEHTDDSGVRGRRGHPYEAADAADSISSLPGVKSYYKSSFTNRELDRILARLGARKLIYTLLVKSGLLYNYMSKLYEIKLYILKANDYKRYSNIHKAVYQVSTFESEAKKVQAYKTDHLSIIADKYAKSFIKKHAEDDYVYLYKTGGYYFDVPLTMILRRRARKKKKAR